MFFSYNHLVNQDGRFAVIWKLATREKKQKSISKETILELNIPELCRALLSYLPSGMGKMSELKNKFSLYLIAQLTYGLTLALDRKTNYLEIECKAAYEISKRIHLNETNISAANLSVRKQKVNEKEARGKKRKHEELFIIDINEIPLEKVNKQVGMALYNQITLQDPIPDLAFNPMGELQDDFLLPSSADILEQHSMFPSMIVERQSSANSQEKLARLSTPERVVEKMPSFENLPPLEPLPESFAIMDTFSALPPQEIGEMNLIEQQAIEEIQRTPQTTKRPASVDIIELVAPEKIIDTPMTIKRRRRAFQMRDDQTLMKWDDLKKNQDDFSSTLRNRAEIMVKFNEEPFLDLSIPFPTVMGRRLNNELISIYKSKDTRKTDLRTAANDDLERESDRFWKYQSSEENLNIIQEQMLDEDLNLIGKAYLHDTPKHQREDIPLIEEDLRQPLPELEDIDTMAQMTRESNLEEARRSAIGEYTSETARPSYLIHSDIMADVTGKATLREESSIEAGARLKVTKNVIIRAINESIGPVSLASIFPPSKTSRRDAARGLAGLLELLKSKEVTVEQETPYGDIWIELPETSVLND